MWDIINGGVEESYERSFTIGDLLTAAMLNRIDDLEDILSRLVKENDLAMPNENYQWMYSPMRVECLKVLEGK